MRRDYDVAIVGGGILGVSTAFALALGGKRRVVLVLKMREFAT